MTKLKGKITAINANRNRRVRRSDIFLDGKFAFSLDNEVIAKNNLMVGHELTEDCVQELTGADRSQRCLNAAFNFLSYRPRSEAETRLRLRRRGFEISDIETALSELKRLNLIDDAGFAEFWVENRNSFRPRSQKMIKQELRNKGIEAAVIDETVNDIDDSHNAYSLALEKTSRLSLTDYQTFRRRLGGYLQRRGFSYTVINTVINKIWKEKVNEER